MKRTWLMRLALAIALTAPLAATAMPVMLQAGETALFNFDLTPVGTPPIDLVFLTGNVSDMSPDASVDSTCYEGLSGTGIAYECGIGAAIAASTPGFADGLFSMSFSALSGSFSVNPIAVGIDIVFVGPWAFGVDGSG